MKVRMLTGMAGISFSYAPGDVVDVSDDEAVRFVENGIAEPVREAVRKTATRKMKREKATR